MAELTPEQRRDGFMREYVALCGKWGCYIRKSTPGGPVAVHVCDNPDALKEAQVVEFEFSERDPDDP